MAMLAARNVQPLQQGADSVASDPASKPSPTRSRHPAIGAPGTEIKHSLDRPPGGHAGSHFARTRRAEFCLADQCSLDQVGKAASERVAPARFCPGTSAQLSKEGVFEGPKAQGFELIFPVAGFGSHSCNGHYLNRDHQVMLLAGRLQRRFDMRRHDRREHARMHPVRVQSVVQAVAQAHFTLQHETQRVARNRCIVRLGGGQQHVFKRERGWGCSKYAVI